MTQRRVVITGLGPVTPIGVGGGKFWNALLEKRNGVHRISMFDPSRFDSQIGGEIDGIKVADYVPKSYRKSAKVMARDIVLAVAAAHGADELAVQDLASDAATDGQVAKANGVGAVAFEDDEAGFSFIIDGGGSAITTGIKGDVEMPFAGEIASVRMFADQTGSIQVDVWKDTYLNFPPTSADSITAVAVPAISSSSKYEDTVLTGWTKTFAKGDVLRFNVDSASTVQRCTLSLSVKKT